MDEGRKRVIGIMAAILAAGKITQHDGKVVPATVAGVANAVKWAEEIMKEIDRQWPEPPGHAQSLSGASKPSSEGAT